MSEDPRKVLRDALTFFARIKRCGTCVPPSEAYDGAHAKEWAEIERRMRDASGAEKAAN